MGWVNVKNYVPKDFQYVLLTIQVEGYHRFVHEGFWTGNEFVIPATSVNSKDVIAWRYMPEPYKD